MKRISAILIISLLLVALSVPCYAESSQMPINHYSISVDAFHGGAMSSRESIDVGSGDSVDLQAFEDGKSFTCWEISGDYDVVSGSQKEMTLTIVPKSDIVAVAYFGGVTAIEGISTDASPIAPKTGGRSSAPFILLSVSIFITGMVMAIRNNKR